MDKAKELIKRFEGLRLKAYICPAGKLTIGYGHVIKEHESKEITLEDAERLLDIDCAVAMVRIRDLVKIKLSDNRMQALISFVFNVGVGNFASSTLLKKINTADWNGAAKEFLRWDKARVNGKMKALPGLTKRRKAEMELFTS